MTMHHLMQTLQSLSKQKMKPKKRQRLKETILHIFNKIKG
jgi:hypothetical protein